MKTIENIRAFALRVVPWIIGVTVLLGSTMVFPSWAYSYPNSKIIIIEIGFAVVIALGLIAIPWSYIKNISRSKIIWGIGVFLLASLIATLFSIDKTLSWYSHLERGTGMFFMLIVSVGSFFSVVLAKYTNTFRKAVLYPIAGAGAVIGLSTIVGYTGFNIIHWFLLGQVAGGGGLTGNSSFAGSFMMMTFFITAYLFFTTPSRNKKIFLGVLGLLTIVNPVIVGYAMFKTGFHGIISLLGDAQGATVSLVLGVVVSLGIYISYARKNVWKWTGRIIASGTVIIVVGALVMLVIPGTAVNKFFVHNATGTRFLYWDIALQSFKDHPIIGTGPETFRYADEHYFNPDFMRKSFKRELYSDKPHNAFLEVLDTTGIVGFIAYLGMFVAIIWTLVRLAKKPENRLLVASTSGLLFAYLLNNFILFDVGPTLMVFFVIIIWLAFVQLQDKGIPLGNTSETFSEKAFTLRAVVGVIIIGVVLFITIPEIVKMRRILVEMYAPLETRAGLYQQSESASPFGAGVTLVQRADVYSQNYLNHIQEVLASSHQSQQQVLADVNALIDEINRSFVKFPKSVQGLVDIGRLESIKVLIENKAEPDVIAVMLDVGNQIKELSPTNPQAYWIIGQAYMYQGKFQEAFDTFEAGLAINPHIPESHQTIIQLAQAIGDKKLLTQALADYERDVISEDR